MTEGSISTLKRATDSLVSLVVIVFIGPLLIPFGLVLKFTGEGEVFFRQVRVGENRKRILFAKVCDDVEG